MFCACLVWVGWLLFQICVFQEGVEHKILDKLRLSCRVARGHAINSQFVCFPLLCLRSCCNYTYYLCCYYHFLIIYHHIILSSLLIFLFIVLFLCLFSLLLLFLFLSFFFVIFFLYFLCPTILLLFVFHSFLIHRLCHMFFLSAQFSSNTDTKKIDRAA